MSLEKALPLLTGAFLLCGCGITTIVEPQEIPSTENGAVAAGNRLFFVGGNSLYELLEHPDGTRDYRTVTSREDCEFTGLTANGALLYAVCTAPDPSSSGDTETMFPPRDWSDLIRVDLRKAVSDPTRVSETRFSEENMLPNGMAVDGRGDIYVSNSYSMLAFLESGEAHPAIIRVRVTDEAGFEIEKTPVVSSEQGGLFPNGIQIRGNRLWYVSANTLYEAEIEAEGLSALEVIYTAPDTRIFDDFAVLPNHVLAIADIPSPVAYEPGAWPPASDPSKLTFVSVSPKAGGRGGGEVVFEYVCEPPVTPSSATFMLDREGPALYVTDVFFGGLYRLGVSH